MRRSPIMLGHIFVLCCSQTLAQMPAPGGKLIELRAVRTTPARGFSVVKSVNDTSFYLADTALITDDDILDAQTDTSASNPGVLILRVHLRPGAAARIHDFTKRHVGKRLALLLAGELSGPPPIIRDAISGPVLNIEGSPSPRSQQFAAAVAARWPSGH